MMPASWGLKGKSRAIAEAEYYYEGEDLEKRLAELTAETDADKEIAKLDVDLKNERVGKVEYEKKVAEIRDEPYINVLEMGVNPEDPKAGFIELDWNDNFVKMLHANGYTGTSDEDVVNQWFNDLCRTILFQENADLDYGLQQSGRQDVVKKHELRSTGEDETGPTSKKD